MQCIGHFRNRVVLFLSLIMSLLLLICILWPWIHAGWLWRESAIDFLVLPSATHLKNASLRVPAIIHQTWHDADTIPINWQQASNSCRSVHPNYEYRLWTDKDAHRLIEKELPNLLPTFDSYPYSIQRADVLRLAALYIYGGIYLDLDIICLKPLDQLRAYQLVLPRTMPVGLSNDFIISEPRHPFILQVLNDLPKSAQSYFTK